MSALYDPNDPWLRPSEAARQLGVTTQTLRRWMHKEVISYVEVGPYKAKRILQSIVNIHTKVHRGTEETLDVPRATECNNRNDRNI